MLILTSIMGKKTMLRKLRQITPENLWNRLARNLIYDSKELLLYCGIRVPGTEQNQTGTDYSDFISRVTKGTDYGAIYDPLSGRIHFEPGYIQNIMDKATRFDFPVYDHSFGPGGIAGFIHEQQQDQFDLKTPNMDHILKQAMIAKNENMPFAFVCARQLAQYEIEQFGIMTKVFDKPIVLNILTQEGINEAEKFSQKGHYIITNHTIFDSPLTLSYKARIDTFVQCAERQIPVMMTTQPFSGQTAPMTPYGLALLTFAEFLAGMAISCAINPQTKVVNGGYPTMCTPGSRPSFKLGSVIHNFTNYLVAYTSRMLDIASIQSGCTMQGNLHENTILETDYETVRAMILWEDMFEGWHMVRHSYGFLDDLASFSFQKAKDDIAALHHIKSLEDVGITSLLANNVRLNKDIQKAETLYNNPRLLFDREDGQIMDIIIETIETFKGDFGKHAHTLKNVPSEWF